MKSHVEVMIVDERLIKRPSQVRSRTLLLSLFVFHPIGSVLAVCVSFNRNFSLRISHRLSCTIAPFLCKARGVGVREWNSRFFPPPGKVTLIAGLASAWPCISDIVNLKTVLIFVSTSARFRQAVSPFFWKHPGARADTFKHTGAQEPKFTCSRAQ